MTDDKAKLLTACQMAFTLNSGNCSGTVRDVAKAMGAPLPSYDANSLIDYFQTHEWTMVDELKAQSLADVGHLVVAGKKNAAGSGHVVVVMPGGMVPSGGYKYTDKKTGKVMVAAFHGKHPRACSNSSGGWPGGISNGDKSVYDSWGSDKNYALVTYWSAP